MSAWKADALPLPGAIGTLGESWRTMLQDGAGSRRQLVDEEGAVTLSISYTPWGDTMEIYGSGMLNLGYLGGVYDAGTGLVYTCPRNDRRE